MVAFKPMTATNAPGTCLWCGGKVKPHATPADSEGRVWFCGLRCGFAFGVTMAAHGHRLQRK